jgi:hypothetical protein
VDICEWYRRGLGIDVYNSQEVLIHTVIRRISLACPSSDPLDVSNQLFISREQEVPPTIAIEAIVAQRYGTTTVARLVYLSVGIAKSNCEGSVCTNREDFVGHVRRVSSFFSAWAFEQHLFVIESVEVGVAKTFVDNRLTRDADGNQVSNERNVQYHGPVHGHYGN